MNNYHHTALATEHNHMTTEVSIKTLFGSM